MAVLDFELLLSDADWNSTLNRAERRYQGFSNRAVQEGNRMEDSFRRLGQLAGGAFVFTKLAELPQQIFKVRGEFQQLEIAFTTMLRSKAKSDELIGQIKDFALTTPYGVKENSFVPQHHPKGGLFGRYGLIDASTRPMAGFCAFVP